MFGYTFAGFGRVFGWIRRSVIASAWIDFGRTLSKAEISVIRLRERAGWLEKLEDSKSYAEDPMSSLPDEMGGFHFTLMRCSLSYIDLKPRLTLRPSATIKGIKVYLGWILHDSSTLDHSATAALVLQSTIHDHCRHIQ